MIARIALGTLVFPLLAALVFVGPVRAAGHGELGPVVAVRIELRDRPADLKLLHDLEIDVDGVYGSWARAYLVPEEMVKLSGLGFDLRLVPDEGGPDRDAGFTPSAPATVPTTYHTYETLTSELQQIAASYPAITRLVSLGPSVQGRELWMMKITNNPGAEEDEPEVHYIAAMHGDEVVGKEMCVDLIHLLTESYGSDPRITALVDGSEIWILPSMNPDGTAAARRYNANNVDLNRNFPDQFLDPNDTPAGRQPETQHVMAWGASHRSSLSANLHGGSVVANYPYDGTPSGASVYSLSPDDSLWVSVARTYADSNPTMKASNSDPSFTNGICNGADWYDINGGMQDWNYVYKGGRELTLEISTVKWPAGSQLPQFWNDNRESMLAYLERAGQGVRGIVRDSATAQPLQATIRVVGSARDTFTDPEVGDFHRILLPGSYTLEVSSAGHATARIDEVVVSASAPATRVDVDLEPLAAELEPVGDRVLDGAGGNGALDPGESADLAVTVENLGSTASGIGAALVPTGWSASIVRPSSSFPDLGAGASAESLPPHFAVSLSPSAPPGSRAGFALAWSAAEGAGTSAPFFVPVGPAVCTTISSTDVPKAIADRATAGSVIAMPADVEISEVDVRVDISHPYVGDLHVRVVSPAGVPVALHSRTGGSSDDIHGWYPADLTPGEPLSRLVGAHAAGTWKLEVTDDVPLNTGTLTGWSLEVCGRPFETSLPPMRLREVTKIADGSAVLTWWPYAGTTRYKVYRSGDPHVPGSFVDVTPSDGDATDATFQDTAPGDLYWLVSGVGPTGEGPISGP